MRDASEQAASPASDAQETASHTPVVERLTVEADTVSYTHLTLVKAGVEDCDVMAAVTQFDNTNLMCAEVGSRLFGVPHVIARLYNPDHERAYMQLGIDYVCGTSLVAEDVFSLSLIHI